ncbi:MAG: transcription elongation factor GreB [Oligoflexia bacterium]|nr:transcription elongation factor GreB [Oligoflexia bacterium]
MARPLTQNEEDEDLPTQTGGKNYITPKGLAKLKAELDKLLDQERPEVVRIVSWAASNGDRSENGDYLYGKKRLREIDKRIRFLTKRIDAAVPVDPLNQKGKKILFGATVKVVNEEGEAKTFSIVGIDETDVAKGKISWISPMGRALLTASEGDSVTVRTPKGNEDFDVEEVSYRELE